MKKTSQRFRLVSSDTLEYNKHVAPSSNKPKLLNQCARQGEVFGHLLMKEQCIRGKEAEVES